MYCYFNFFFASVTFMGRLYRVLFPSLVVKVSCEKILDNFHGITMTCQANK